MELIWQNTNRAINRNRSPLDNSVYYGYCAMVNEWIILDAPLTLEQALAKLVFRNFITSAQAKELKSKEIEYLKILDKETKVK